MKKSFMVIITLFFLLSCTHNDKKAGTETYATGIKKEAMDIAIEYAKGKFKESKDTVDANGIVTITDNQVNFLMNNDIRLKYVIDPAKIVVGLIDDDADEDAIITISLFNGYIEIPESLILIKTDGKLVLNRSIEADMKIMGIKDRVITAEIFTRSRSSPLRNCAVCKEVVKYQFRTGDLVRIE
jgi:hypothetical protein